MGFNNFPECVTQPPGSAQEELPHLHAQSATTPGMLEELQSHRDCDSARYGTNPQHIKGLNGHKTDPKDAQWIAELLETGKLKGSMPNRNIKVRP